jgi:cob(I)alamin adenosyltransferase
VPTNSLRESQVATGKGDDGSTGLLFGGARISKDDFRTEAYGTIDEAVAAMGLARAELGALAGAGVLNPVLTGLADLILRFQRELFVAGAELATNPDAWDRQVEGQTRVSRPMLDGVETVLAEMEAGIAMPREFVVPGETPASAAIEVARTVLRRAERRTVTVQREGLVPGQYLLPYLNRLADLLWVMARAAEQAEARIATPARVGGRPQSARADARRTAAGDRLRSEGA